MNGKTDRQRDRERERCVKTKKEKNKDTKWVERQRERWVERNKNMKRRKKSRIERWRDVMMMMMMMYLVDVFTQTWWWWCIYPDLPTWAECNTRSIFKRRTAGLNSEVFLSKTGSPTKFKEPSLISNQPTEKRGVFFKGIWDTNFF